MHKKIYNTYKGILFSVLLIFLFPSCKSVENCVENQELGNMGSIINTNLDEHSPSILTLPDHIKQAHSSLDTNDYLYFTATRYDLGSNEAVYNLILNDINAGAELVNDIEFPLNDTTKFRNAGLPVFRYNTTTNKLDLFFAALPKFGRLSRDIYFAEKDLDSNKWSKPIQLPINSARWESHPAISPDGKILLFSSDREGGQGDIDIWVSFLKDDGTWDVPINLGPEINTKATDYAPSFTTHNDLIFASNGHNKTRKDFDIYLAKFDSVEKKWNMPQMYNFPINTEFDETGAAVWKNRIFVSSNRRGGCGGKDIYSFQLCGPIIISGRVKCTNPEQIVEGNIYLYDGNQNIVDSSEVSPDGTFKINNAEPNKKYILDYKNKCYPYKKNIYDFIAPCSDSSVIMTVINMVMPEKTAEIELTEIDIPFFVTGYYKPNTETNLNALKLGFSYNLYGKNEKTKYIENPGDNYDQYTTKVEAGLNDAIKYIANMMAALDNKCKPADKKGNLHINVQGWADPRKISIDAEYSDEDINDTALNLQVKKGTKMTNELLSTLRAYFTAKHFEAALTNELNIGELANSIKWTIEGKGADNTENLEDELKRKVKISLQFVE